MNGPIFIVSDNHFSMDKNHNESERRNKLFKVFDKIKNFKNSTLIIGGDFFDYWFEYKNVIPAGYDDLIESFKDLTKNGVEVHYILGNHDYWDFGYLNRETKINIHNKDFEFNYFNQKILMTHGDGLLKNDYGYRALKKIIRRPIFIKVFKLFPPNLTCKLAKIISKSSSGYNHHDKYVDIIKKDMLDFSKRKWDSGFDSVLIGHYHQIGIHENNKKKMIFLGDWLTKFTVTMINEKNYWQGDWQNFVDLA